MGARPPPFLKLLLSSRGGVPSSVERFNGTGSLVSVAVPCPSLRLSVKQFIAVQQLEHLEHCANSAEREPTFTFQYDGNEIALAA